MLQAHSQEQHPFLQVFVQSQRPSALVQHSTAIDHLHHRSAHQIAQGQSLPAIVPSTTLENPGDSQPHIGAILLYVSTGYHMDVQYTAQHLVQNCLAAGCSAWHGMRPCDKLELAVSPRKTEPPCYRLLNCW